MLKTSPRDLSLLARSRASRSDIGQTAVWTYRALEPKGKILLVHGFRGDHHGLEAIAGALDEYDVLIPDLPGYGKSIPFSGKHNLTAYGLWLKELCAGVSGLDLVLGHSFGSLVVASGIAQGLSVPQVALLNPITTRSAEQKGFANRISGSFYNFCAATGTLGSLLLRSPIIVRGMSVVMATTRDWRLRSFIHNQHGKYFSSYVQDRVAFEGFEAASRGSVLDYVDDLPESLLLIAGAKDLIAPLANQIELQKRVGGSSLKVIDSAGHLTHYETPFEVAITLREFLEKH